MEYARNMMSNKNIKYAALIIVLTIVALVAFYMGMKGFKNKRDKANSVYKPSEVSFVLYYVDWCPHCVTTKSVFESVKEQWDGKRTEDGLEIKFSLVDCTDDSTNHVVNGKQINAFPTIYFDDGVNSQVEFKAKCEMATFTKFIEEMTKDI